jgi:UDP-N-acetylmuramate: L-alanyl-gamma-D-glutamyl-meso-diaminopimelate ligase
MRRKVFQDVLPESLALADAVLLGPVNRAQLLADEDRLSPEAIAGAILERGRPAKALASAAEIADYLAEHAGSGDVVLVMSNGSFDGLCMKLVEKLQTLAGTHG